METTEEIRALAEKATEKLVIVGDDTIADDLVNLIEAIARQVAREEIALYRERFAEAFQKELDALGIKPSPGE